ncbi:hypothetical protein ES703_123247 [subsurface metagenome]
MRRLDISDYTVELLNPKAGEKRDDDSLEPETLDIPYDVKRSLVEMLLSKQLELNARALLERDEIARKILHCTDGFVFLEEEEYKKLVSAIETLRGLGRPDVPLMRRILEETEQVEVEEKK